MQPHKPVCPDCTILPRWSPRLLTFFVGPPPCTKRHEPAVPRGHPPGPRPPPATNRRVRRLSGVAALRTPSSPRRARYWAVPRLRTVLCLVLAVLVLTACGSSPSSRRTTRPARPRRTCMRWGTSGCTWRAAAPAARSWCCSRAAGTPPTPGTTWSAGSGRTCARARSTTRASVRRAAVSAPMTPRVVADTLHDTLAAADVPAPYVVVGHSLAGLSTRVFVGAIRTRSPGSSCSTAPRSRSWRTPGGAGAAARLGRAGDGPAGTGGAVVARRAGAHPAARPRGGRRRRLLGRRGTALAPRADRR